MDSTFNPVEYISEPRWMESKLGLERVEILMRKLGNPERELDIIHVAGTNGKGSVCSYLSNIMQADGKKCGLFTSPAIECFEDRVKVDGANISCDELYDATIEVKEHADQIEVEFGEHPTEFELMFAVAIVHFVRQGCDVAVLETGLGGTLDATNVVDPKLCVITQIGLDHTDMLGETIGEIAGEKAGIIKQGVPVITCPQEPDAMAVIKSRCDKLGCSLHVTDLSKLNPGSVDMAAGIRSFEYRGRAYTTALLASYQPMNAALAIDAATEFGVTPSALEEGIAQTSWPGRFEIVGTSPLTVVDGSHNPQGVQALANTLEELGLGDITFVMGVLADKDYTTEVTFMIPFAKRFIVYKPGNPRALEAESLAETILNADSSMDVQVCPAPCDAIAKAINEEGPEGVVVAFGTLYAISEIKRAIKPLLA